MKTLTTAIPADKLRWEHTIPAGTHWSGMIRRGTVLRFTDVEGGANCAVIFYNPEDKLERYNMPDTLKAQHTALLSRGHCLYSDMGRIFASIVEDTVGWHDSFCGVSDAEMVRARYGESHYQQAQNAMLRNGRDSLLIELGKYGLGPRDLGPTVNLFSKVVADAEGKLSYVDGNSQSGDSVDLRFEMNTLLCLSTAPHPLNHAAKYSAKPVKLTAYVADPVGADDYCRNFRPENQRGFINTERYVG